MLPRLDYEHKMTEFKLDSQQVEPDVFMTTIGLFIKAMDDSMA